MLTEPGGMSGYDGHMGVTRGPRKCGIPAFA